MEVWRALGVPDPKAVPMLEPDAFVALADRYRAGPGATAGEQ